MTVCRYAGLNQKARFGTLEASRVVTGPALGAFVVYADQKGWQVLKNGVSFGCPMSQGSVDLLEVVYASGSPLNVSVAIDGCLLVSNGSRTVLAGGIGAHLTPWVGVDSLPQA